MTQLTPYTRDRIAVQQNGCWHWTGPITKQSYGLANLPDGERRIAHRLVYELLVGSIPDGLHLDHQCHNRDADCPGGVACMHRRCVNPDHMEPATPRENVRRGKTAPALNVVKEMCPQGHPYSHVDNRGWRKCETCQAERQQARARARGVTESRAWASTCANGHEYTPETTRWSERGYRHCKVCDHERAMAVTARGAKRKPCKGCGGPKPAGRSRYCFACRPPLREAS